MPHCGEGFLRRVFLLAFVLLVVLPISIGVSGCGSKSGGSAGNLCPGFNPGGTVIGQPVSVILQPYTTGLSLNTGQNASLSTPTATDCTGANVSLTRVVYSVDTASANAHLIDINPASGNICAGTWNRNSGGGVPDYSTCMPTGSSGVGKVTATSAGTGSNAVQVYVHPVITNIEIGAASTDCVNDPASNCSQYGAGLPAVTTTSSYNPNDCLSFGQSAQLVTRFYKGPKSNTVPDPNNVTYDAGLPAFTLQTAQIGTFDANNRGIFLASAPGSSVVTA